MCYRRSSESEGLMRFFRKFVHAGTDARGLVKVEVLATAAVSLALTTALSAVTHVSSTRLVPRTKRVITADDQHFASDLLAVERLEHEGDASTWHEMLMSIANVRV